MQLRFRPLAGFTLLCAPLFAALVALGLWQLERLHWKLALIAQIGRSMAAPPISLDAALALGTKHVQYRRVTLSGRFDNSKESYVFTTGPDGAPVYHVLTPLLLGDGRAMMIDRGYIPTTLRDPATRRGGEPRGTLTVTGVWRTPDRPGWFTPAPDLDRRVWFARDLAGIARAQHLRLAAPAVLEATASPSALAWPRAGQTRIDLPNDHLQYALTWFMLAGALVGVYIAFHCTQGRLRLGTASSSETRSG